MSDVVKAMPIIDELATPEGSVMLLAEGDTARVVRVSPLASAVVELTTGGMPLSSLGAELTERFGAPPGDADAAVRALVDELISQGLLEWADPDPGSHD